MTNTNEHAGHVAQVLGNVVDCEFENARELPLINDAIRVPMPPNAKGEALPDLILEVQTHLGHSRVRCVAMDATDGLARGVACYATGAPITVPVGEVTLGRIFNVLGR